MTLQIAQYAEFKELTTLMGMSICGDIQMCSGAKALATKFNLEPFSDVDVKRALKSDWTGVHVSEYGV